MTRALDLVSLGYVMDRLGLSKAHVLSLVKSGAIPSHPIRPGPTGRTMWVFEARAIERVRQQRSRRAR